MKIEIVHDEKLCCWLHSDLICPRLLKKKKKLPFLMSILQRLSLLRRLYAERLGRISDICVCCFHLGLDLGGTGNFPWTGCDGSLLASSGPIAAGVLDATA